MYVLKFTIYIYIYIYMSTICMSDLLLFSICSHSLPYTPPTMHRFRWIANDNVNSYL